jgi:LacI family transcriptional regulator
VADGVEPAAGRRRAAIRDIAARAGVSAMTVSRALSGKSDVAPATRDAVLRQAQALGYPLGKAGAARRRSGLIGLIVPYIRGEGDYFAEIVTGAADALAERDARLVLCQTRHDHDREVSLLDRLLHGTTDGGLFIGPSESPAELAQLHACGYPFVVIDPSISPGDEIATVAATNVIGARAATEHLIALGHRRIGVITGRLGSAVSIDRLAGYHAAIVARGLVLGTELVVETDFTVSGGEAAAHRLLALPDPPTAIFAFNDNMAVGAMRAARERGLVVPDHLSVVGFDDIEVAALVTPALTTVRQPLKEMGRAAAGLLYRQIEGRPLDAPRLEVSTRLIVRASTSAPRS